VRSREEIIATVTTNIRQYYTTVLQTDGILILVQDEGELLVRSREEIYHLFVDLWYSIVLCLL
jgi:hypothetical protein